MLPSDDTQDIKNFINQTKLNPPQALDPVPPFKKFEPYQYSSQNLRSPFEPFVRSSAVRLPGAPLATGPDFTRRREALEAFPLDALQMVGTLAKGDKIFALVKDTQGLIHRISVGSYMGHNFGKTERITENCIEIVEWVPTLQGQYVNRGFIMKLTPAEKRSGDHPYES